MQPHRSTCLPRTKVVSPKDNGEAALFVPSIELSFYIAVKEMPRDLPQLSCKAVLNEQVAIALGGVPLAQCKDVIKNSHEDVEDRSGDRIIGDEAKAAVKQLVNKELKTLVQKLFDGIICMLSHDALCQVRSVDYNVVQQVMLDLLRKGVIGKILEDHNAKLCDISRLSKKFLTWSSLFAL